MAAPDQAISTNYLKNKILKEESDSKCWLCEQNDGPIDHLTSGFSILVKKEYLMRHDKICAHLRYSICKALGIETTQMVHTHTHTYTQASAWTGKCYTVVESNSTHRHRSYSQRATNIIIKHKKEKICILIDVAIPADRNVMQKEAEKKLKYKSSCVKIQWVKNLKCMIIPVIIGATRLVTKGWRKNLEAVPAKHSVYSLQKTAVIGTSHIIWEVLQCETGSLSGEDHRWFKRSTGKKRHLIRDDNDDDGLKCQSRGNLDISQTDDLYTPVLVVSRWTADIFPKSLVFA